MNTNTVEKPKTRDKHGEIDFIRVTELRYRTRLLVERDGLSDKDARDKAGKWLQDEMQQGEEQLSLPIESSSNYVYRIYYRRFGDETSSDYHILDIVAKEKLYSWQTTYNVLAEIIRDRFDENCEKIATFHPTNEHDFDVRINKNQVDEIAKQRRIAELEKEIETLKK